MNICTACGRTFSDAATFCGMDGAALVPIVDGNVGHSVGPYHIEALIGRGGIASVYRARGPSFLDPVAVKVLRSDKKPTAEMVGRFKREMKAIVQLQHPHIVDLLDSGLDPRAGWYVVLPLLKGETLLERVDRLGALPWPEVDAIARQVADALAVAHDCGIVHRDIKGENLHVETRRDGRLHVRLLDFGLAKMGRRVRPDGVADSDMVRTRTGQIMGSPPCMAPEQVLAMEVDARSDLYSFGIVLFECLAGGLPFDAPTAYEMLRMHVHVAPPRPSSRPGMHWVPAAVEDAVLALLQKRPSQRPQSAAEFLALWDAAAPAGKRAWEARIPA